MKRNILLAFAIAIVFCSCGGKKTEGTINYSVEYQLPEQMKQYAEYLPKQAVVYFKGDSTISIQDGTQESTSVVTNSKAGFMRALLKSTDKKYAVDYDKAAQAEEVAGMPTYTYTKSEEQKDIAGYKATRYILKDKVSGEKAEAWFTRDVAIIPNSLTSTLDTTLGVPLAFTLKQNGMVIKTTATSVKFEQVPVNAFSTPIGYEFLTPKQFREMTGGN